MGARHCAGKSSLVAGQLSMVRNGWWRYASIDNFPSDLYADDISGEHKKLRRLEPHQAYKTLGVFIAPDGNLTDHFNKLLTLAT